MVIQPTIPYKKAQIHPFDNFTNKELKPFVDLAGRRCEYIMNDLIWGHPLTESLAKAYIQGFIDCANVTGILDDKMPT